MVRIDHAADYFMPLFCSSKPFVRVNCVLASMLLYVALLMGYVFMGKPIQEPDLFNPVAQDYFRACLLGIFSPMLYYFVQTFLVNLNRRYLVLNLLVDFLFNDWFVLLIIVCLAYPQQEQTKNYDVGSSIWHIVPRQTYVFGVTWSLGEFIVSVFGNLFNYKELPYDCEDQADGQLLERDEFSNRDEITLSKCLEVRRDSSSISNNVYFSETDFKAPPRTYGSTGPQRAKSPDYSPDGTEAILLVDPSDNSLRLAPLDYDKDPRVLEAQRQWGSLLGAAESQNASGIPVKQFMPIRSKVSLFKALCEMLLVQLSNVLLIVGQSLITSIYFTYVPGHEHLFTTVVNYFGKRTFTYFLLTVMVPFTILNLSVNAAIYLWKDFESWFNYRNDLPADSMAQDFYNTEISLQRSRPTSLPQDLSLSEPALIPPANSYSYGYYNASQDSLQTNVPRILVIARYIFASWKRMAMRDAFVLTSMLLWGVAVFVAGVIATVPE
ncbi:uncharacterized protein ZBIST_2428 [Zygosaccharomyces bailii]|nr:uncharacterized protein ZBIST_2428 [Zygosaccharomyces bailii]